MDTLIEVEPLKWPEYWVHPTRVQRLLIGVPIIGIDKRARTDIRKQLSTRSAQVFQAWPSPVSPVYQQLSDVLMRELDWPNPFFIPADPCEILFWDPSFEMRCETVMHWIETQFGSAAFPDNYLQLSYGNLVQHITQLAVHN